MKIWQQYPFIRLLVPFIAGILAAMQIDVQINNSFFVLSVLLLGIHGWFTFFFKKKIAFTYRWIFGIPVNIFLFIAGYQLTILNTARFDRDNVSHFTDRKCELLVLITEPPVEKANSFKLIGEPLFLNDSVDWKTVSGKILLYFAKDSLIPEIKYGDQLLLNTTLNPVSHPKNPGEFNYQRYLANRGIYDQAYVKAGDWSVVARGKGYALISLALELRHRFLKVLESNNITGKEFAVISALLLGCSDYLDSDQLKEYSGSGVMHILSVSGLHVGIIYVFLNILLGFMDKKRSMKIFKVILLILLIWFYALVTGLSPSVLRAATMFSFIAVGGVLKRNVNIYNSLAASAFVLLLFNPFLVTSVGFQLSYLAVAGIAWLYRPLDILYIPRNRIIRFIWQTTAVSIAATAATLPLTLFYFRQFPNLFLVTNLIAIPLSTLIIYTGIFVLVTSPVHIFSSMLSSLLVIMIRALNGTVKFIENVPFAVTGDIYISQIELIILSVLIFGFCTYLLTKSNRFLIVSLASLILFFTSTTIRNYYQLQQQKVVIYNLPKATAIDFINANHGILLADSIAYYDDSKFNFHIKNNRIISGITSFENILPVFQNYRSDVLIKRDCFIQFKDRRLAIIDPDFNYKPTGKLLNLDYLLLSHDPSISIRELADIFSFKMVVIDNSNSQWKTTEWIAECEEGGIMYFATRNSGALVIEK